MRRDLAGAQYDKRVENHQALSQFGHPNATGLRFIATGAGQTTDLRAGPGFDGRVAPIAYYILLVTAQTAVPLVGQFIGGREPTWTTEAERLREDVLTWVKMPPAVVSGLILNRPEARTLAA